MIEGNWYKEPKEGYFLRFWKVNSSGYYLFDKLVGKKSNKKYIFCNFHPLQQGWLIPATKEDIIKWDLN